MTELNLWLAKATHRLSKDSALKVRAEIEQHYEMAREAAISRGVPPEEASRIALCELGDAREANCAYRKVMLTSAEARLLRESNLESRAVCSNPWLKWTALSLPGIMLLAAVAALLEHKPDVVMGALLAALLMALTFIVPFMPVYTRQRGRVVRIVRWAILAYAMALIFGKGALSWSWLLAACFWPIISNELRRISIRRKLPIAEWPKQLYL